MMRLFKASFRHMKWLTLSDLPCLVISVLIETHNKSKIDYSSDEVNKANIGISKLKIPRG